MWYFKDDEAGTSVVYHKAHSQRDCARLSPNFSVIYIYLRTYIYLLTFLLNYLKVKENGKLHTEQLCKSTKSYFDAGRKRFLLF